MPMTEVVERVRAGDRQAYAELVTHYQEPLFRYLGRMGLRQARAEEVAQETFLRAWTHIDGFDSRRGNFSTWLYTIAHRLALNELRRHATRRELAMTDAEDAPSEVPEPSEALETAERRQRVRAALLELPPRERSAIALAYIADLALTDVARIEGCTVGAVKTRLHRARSRLARLMEKDLE